MSVPQTLHLHAGAHKTATTHLQHRLQAVRDELLHYGVRYDGPKYWRTATRARPWTRSRKPLKLWLSQSRGLSRYIPDEPLWLISEENAAGLPVALLRAGPLYPNLVQRIRFIRSLLPETRFQLFFSVRSYADYFRSMYSEIMRNRHAPPFSEFYDPLRFESCSWHQLLQGLCTELDEHEITLWRYEDFSALETNLLQAMTANRLPAEFEFPLARKRTRPSLSAPAMAALADLPAPESMERHKERIAAIARRYPARKHERFDPWSLEEAERLEERYRKDLASIRTDFPDITFFQPESNRS